MVGRQLFGLCGLLLMTGSLAAVAGPKPPVNERIEQEVIRLTNLERAKLKLPPCLGAKLLTTAARGHSASMLKLNFFDHTSPVTGRHSPSDRAHQAGWPGQTLAENIFEAEGVDADQLPAVVVRDWMTSPVHRQNILEPQSDRIGVGVAFKGKKFLVTQMFGVSSED